MSKYIVYQVGHKFNPHSKLSYVKEVEPYVVPSTGKRSRRVMLQCECGNYHTATVGNARQGLLSCLECRKYPTGEPLYQTWNGIRKRCYNPNHSAYKNYGGRGISMCPEWLEDFYSFQEWALANGWHKELDTDRIDNEGNYEPSNCRFVSRAKNASNRRNSRWWFVDGVRYASSPIAAKALGVTDVTIRNWCHSSNKPNCYSELKYDQSP